MKRGISALTKIASVASRVATVAAINSAVYVAIARHTLRYYRESKNDKRRNNYSKKNYGGIGGQHSVDPW